MLVDEVIRKIEAQQKKLSEADNAYWVGEQLKDICRSVPEQADIVSRDLDMESMSIEAAERKIQKYADEHKKGRQSVVPPQVADRILREFYGLSGTLQNTHVSAPEKPKKMISLADFL